MNTKLITTIVTAVFIVGLVAWDLVVNFNKIEGDTVSEVIGGVFKVAPILAVILGVVAGHLVSNFPGMSSILTFISERPLVAFVYGVVGGFFFWNMGR